MTCRNEKGSSGSIGRGEEERALAKVVRSGCAEQTKASFTNDPFRFEGRHFNGTISIV